MGKKDLLKKISLGIASLALIIPLANLNNINVNARKRNIRTHRVYRHHKRAARKIGRRKSRNHKQIVRKHPARKYYESQAQWYKDNSLKLFKKNIKHNHSYRNGFFDSSGLMTGDGSTLFTQKYDHNPQYKNGWILGDNLLVYLYDHPIARIKSFTTPDYQKALNLYNSGLTYSKYHRNNHIMIYNHIKNKWYKYVPDD